MDQGGIEERKLVTVLFADLVDSTALAESIDPERLRRLLEAYFRAMAEVIERWGGTIQKYIGDAIMAVFGVPAVRENDAERGLRAAMAMLERLDSLNDELEARHGVRLSVRIGVNTGDVIAPAGELGTALIVAGDAVNVAARLQAAASPNGILAGPRTHDAARTTIEFGDPVDLMLKGKAEVVRAWHVVGARAEPVRGIPGLRAPMVGRDPERATLEALLDEAVERGEPRLAMVYGPPGIGKSRLVAEVAAAAAGAATPARMLRGRSLAVGQGGTYWALTEILRSIAGGTSPELLREAIAGPLARLGLDEGEVARTLAALATTSGLEPENAGAELTPERVSQELQLAWSRLVSALTLDGPLVIVFEDLHWAGYPLLEVLAAIVTRSTGPLLVLGTARPELIDRKPGFLQARDDTASVTLRPLSDAASGQLIEGLLEIADLPAALRSELVAKAEGNPFFLEEMLRRLIDEGAIVEEGGRWRATAAATTVRLPDSIHGLIAARIDGLGAPAKALLREASVVGRSFWLPAIETSVGGPEAAAGSIRELEARGLVTVRPTSSLGSIVEYQFRHVLIRDVAYGSVPKSRRGRAHAALATWLEDAAGERKPAFAEAIADHYRAALLGEDADLAWLDDPAEREAVRTRAVVALIEAGEGARRVNALARAIELHEAALQLVETPAERARAVEALGDDHYHIFRPLPALEQYEAALAQARAEGRTSDEARLAMKTAQVFVYRSASDDNLRPPAEIDALLDSGLAANPDPAIRAHLLAMSGQMRVMYSSIGAEDPRPIAARRAATQEALALATDLGDSGLLVDVLLGALGLGYETDDVAGNTEVGRRLLSLEAQTTDPEQRIRMLTTAVGVLADAGDPALELYALAQRAASMAATSRHSRLHTTAIDLWVAYRAGTWVDVEPILQEHLRDSEIEGTSCPVIRGGVSTAAAIAGWQGRHDLAGAARARVEATYMTEKFYAGSPINALRAAGDLDRARVVALDMFERLKVPGWDDVIVPAIDLAVDLGEDRGDWSLVERMVALGRSRAPVMALVNPTADRAEGALLAAQGDRAAARPLLEAALAGFERLQMPFEVARTARLLAAAGEPGDAATAEFLARAASLEAGLGIRPFGSDVEGRP